jgi:hypothetical protein
MVQTRSERSGSPVRRNGQRARSTPKDDPHKPSCGAASQGGSTSSPITDRRSVLKARYGDRPDIVSLDDDTPFDVLLLLRTDVHGWAAAIQSLGRGPDPVTTLGAFRRMKLAALRVRPRIGDRVFAQLATLRRDDVVAVPVKHSQAMAGRRALAPPTDRTPEQRREALSKEYGRHPQFASLGDAAPIDVLLLHNSSVKGWVASIIAFGRGPEALLTLGDLRRTTDAALRARPRVGTLIFAELRAVCPYQETPKTTPPTNQSRTSKRTTDRAVVPSL